MQTMINIRLMKAFTKAFGCLICFVGGASHAEGLTSAGVTVLEEVVVVGVDKDLQDVSGSVAILDEKDLDAFDYVDLGKLLSAVPGVYVRGEDGFGLRPNIGIRGAAAERSQKITLMKDGVLITPAPYSAPAAYYVPNVSRIAAVEVLKGPAAIRYGPHTVGGAINFLSPNIPEDTVSRLDVSAGSYGFQKLQLSSAGSRGPVGYFVDGLSYSSDGFKDLDGGDTLALSAPILAVRSNMSP